MIRPTTRTGLPLCFMIPLPLGTYTAMRDENGNLVTAPRDIIATGMTGAGVPSHYEPLLAFLRRSSLEIRVAPAVYEKRDPDGPPDRWPTLRI